MVGVFALSFAGALTLGLANAYSAPNLTPFGVNGNCIVSGLPYGGLLKTNALLEYKCGDLHAAQYQEYVPDGSSATYFYDPSQTSVLGGELWLGKDVTDLNNIKYVQDPTDPQDVATKAYVDAVFNSGP